MGARHTQQCCFWRNIQAAQQKIQQCTQLTSELACSPCRQQHRDREMAEAPERDACNHAIDEMRRRMRRQQKQSQKDTRGLLT